MDDAASGGQEGGASIGRFPVRGSGAAGVKKNELKPWQKKEWCIPPEGNAEFVCTMEDVLEVYARPYDPLRPQVCMDELSTQLIGEIRTPVPAKPGPPERDDSEYVRNGTANIFCAIEPLNGEKTVSVTERRTKTDWALFMRTLVDERYPEADNLNTHTPASFYEAFPPEEARRLAEKIEFHPTPRHGSWLNMAETGLSVLSRQCLQRRMPDRKTLQKEISAWTEADSKKPVKIDWRLTTPDARIELKKLYPSILNANSELLRVG